MNMKRPRLLVWALAVTAILAILDGLRIRIELSRERDKHERHEAFTKAFHRLDEFGRLHYLLIHPGDSSGAAMTRAQVESFLVATAREAGQRIIEFTSQYGQPVGTGVDWSEGATILKWYLQDHEPKMATELASCIKQPKDWFPCGFACHRV